MKAHASFPLLMLAFALCVVALAPAWSAGTVSAASPDSPKKDAAASGASVASAAGKEADKPSVPNAYRTLSLGMDIDSVKKELLADPLYGYRGERDVSLLPGENRSLIETSGPSFVRRAWFQFYDDKLYIMTFTLDPEKIDYYSVYSKLVAKSGEPASLDPRKAVWGDDKTTLSLERPLTVKYVDVKTFTDLVGKSGVEKADLEKARETFLNDF
jgi:hypothetical protein